MRRGKDRDVLALAEIIGNRIEGLPTKKVEKTQGHTSVFIFSDGTSALPEPKKIGAGATPAAASPEERIILGGTTLVSMS